MLVRWKVLLIRAPSRVNAQMHPTSSVLRVILEAHLDHRGEDWTLCVDAGHHLKFSTRMTWALFFASTQKLICMYVSTTAGPLSFSMQGPIGGICIEWCEFCFQGGKFLQIVLHFYFSLSCFLLGKQLFAWQKWMWSIGENERPFLLQRKLPFAFAKKKKEKSKTYETKPQIFPCLQTLWKRAFSPVARIFSHTTLPSSKNYDFNGKSPNLHLQNLLTIIKYRDYYY